MYPGVMIILQVHRSDHFVVVSSLSSDVQYLFFYIGSSLSIREGNGTPLQYSCLENPMDGGAWWAAIYGVTQSRTRLM